MTKYEFRTEPMPHQRKAINKMIERKGVAALLMDPGTGKTKPTIDYLGMLTEVFGSLDALVSAPLTALDTWADEIEKHLPERIKAEVHVLDSGSILDKAKYISELGEVANPGVLRVLVINHDAFKYRHKVPGLKTVTVQDRIIKAVTNDYRPSIIVVDESHRIKTHTSNVSQAFAKMGKYAPRRIILTGTVAPRNPLDVYGQWQFLNPNRLPGNWHHFRFELANYGGFENRQIISWNTAALKALKEKLAIDSFVAKKREVLSLEVPTDISLPVKLSPKEEDAYISMGKELIVELPKGEASIAPTALTKMLRLRQLTGGFIGFVRTDDSRSTEDIGNSKLEVCMDKLRDLVEANEKVVVFAHFRRDIARISEACNKEKGFNNIPIYEVTGDTPEKERKRQRKAFKNLEGPAIFVAQMRTMSLAVNEFVVCSYAIFYSLSERRDDYIQARDRLDRNGQTNPVVFYHLVVPHSIDEALLDSYRDKGTLESIILGRAKEILTLGRGD